MPNIHKEPFGHGAESNLEWRARKFATTAHRGQVRKYTGEPYIWHPKAVADMVRTVPHNDSMLAAAWLHDCCEDCGVSLETIAIEFGSVVCVMVSDLTDASKPSDGKRDVRKRIDLEHIKTASPEAKTIKLADIISNSESILKHDPVFAKIYLQEKRALLDNALLEGNLKLWARADLICKRAGYPMLSSNPIWISGNVGRSS